MRRRYGNESPDLGRVGEASRKGTDWVVKGHRGPAVPERPDGKTGDHRGSQATCKGGRRGWRVESGGCSGHAVKRSSHHGTEYGAHYVTVRSSPRHSTEFLTSRYRAHSGKRLQTCEQRSGRMVSASPRIVRAARFDVTVASGCSARASGSFPRLLPA